MKCFVTGSAGYIGNALTERLVSEGHAVTGLVHHSILKQPLKNVTYIKGDITKKDSFLPYIEDVDIVFHCAAYVKDYGPRKIFNDVNIKGTHQLVDALKDSDLKQFLFFSHLAYESSSPNSLYSQSKQIAENFLQQIYKETGFPVTIIHPGNVFGPGKTTWVIRPVEAICKKRLLFIDNGNGVFLHTYIENLLDALLLCINEPKTIGKIILITDGDNNITWQTYFNDLAVILGNKPITKSISKRSARLIGRLMMTLFPLFGVNPWITPLAVDILTNTKTYTLTETQELINYTPKISYQEAMKQIGMWIKKEVTC